MSQVLVCYVCLMCLSLSVCNVYVVWLLMEMMLLFFFLTILSQEVKNVGMVIYFFFQSVMSLMLFMAVFFWMGKFIILCLIGKLGLFPFFYWVVVVSTKMSFLGNIFVLGFQKFVLFWLVWLLVECSMSVLYLFGYSSLFFVFISLLMVSDLWLLLVYSSIANTGVILVSVVGSQFVFTMSLYLGVVVSVVISISKFSSRNEMVFLVLFFLVVPPFVLFFMKFYIFLSLDFVMKLGFFLAFLDVMVLLYYFSLVFMSLMLTEVGSVVYSMNLLVLGFMLIFSNCVAMNVFN